MFDFGLTPDQEDRAKKLHEESVVIDMLNASHIYDDYFLHAKQGGLTAASYTIGLGVPPRSPGEAGREGRVWSYEAAIRDLAEWCDIFRNKSDEVVPVTSTSDVLRAKADAKVGIILNFQNTICLGEHVRRLDFFNKMGVWVIQLTYNHQNLVGSGCLERGNYGLSEFGIRVIRRMNELGMVVDVAHCGQATMMDAIEVSEKPIACTHTNLKALCDTPRCKADEALKALAAKGGVVGLSAIPGFISGKPRITINDYLDQIDYAVRLLGADHVGIGTDFVRGLTWEHLFGSRDWGRRLEEVHIVPEIWPPEAGHQGLEDTSKLLNVTRGLVSRGYKDDEIAKIIGGNWMRLLEEVRAS